MPPSDQTRLLLVEDVPQVAQYIRGLLSAQASIKLLDVLTDGSRVIATMGQLRPDIVLVDALLQGRIKGMQLVEQIRAAALGVPVIVLTVPQQPIETSVERGVHGVLAMPFSGYDLITRVSQVRKEFATTTSIGPSTIVSVFAPKGGVGKTTIAFNLACAIHQLGERTVLIDGSLQFGDLRSLLKVPADAPSILDLPTDRITESDLQDVLWRDPSGIDILLAPPRIEMAEMVTTRDIEKVLSLLRQLYEFVIIDTRAALSDDVLVFLDSADLILQVLTYDSMAIRSLAMSAETFAAIGYPPSKLTTVLNRSDASGGFDKSDVEQALGSPIDFEVVSDGRLVLQSNNEGIAFVSSSPESAIAQGVRRIADSLAAHLVERSPAAVANR
jgi:pilus assembly protein CpaE